jgi:hypothetical protein
MRIRNNCPQTLILRYPLEWLQKTRLTNFDFFASKLYQSNINLLVIECAFGDVPFSLYPSPNVLQVRAKDIMWQKERLLNVAISRLPRTCTKVAWLDCDILFENPEWLVETSRMLEDYPVVQPFEEVIRLPRGSHAFTGKGERSQSFAAIYFKKPQGLLLGDFGFHGHTGFAWAARREILSKHGLYDACIIGGADHLMAHAFCGDWDSPCFSRVIGQSQIHHQHAAKWSQNVYKDVRANVGFM